MTRFVVVPDRSKVSIHAESSLHPIDGEATGLTGYVDVPLDDGRPDLTEQPSARVELPVSELSSGNNAYDKEMRRRLEARKYPTIRGELTKAEEAGDDTYRVEGELTFHGTTRTVTTDMQVRIEEGRRLEARWTQTIDIRDFDLKPPKILMFKVDPEVEVTVDLVAEADEGGEP